MLDELLIKRTKRIAFNEMRTALREGRMLLLAITSWILFLSSLYVGFLYYKNTSSDRALSQQQVRALWLEQEDKNPHAAGHYGTYAFKPLSIFNLLEKGIDPYSGEAIRIETHKQNPPEIRAAEDATFLLRSGELTVGFAFLYIIPLLIIVVVHGMISKEKEQGTLKLAICQGLTSFQMLFGKVCGAIMILSVIIFPIIALLGLVIFRYAHNEIAVFTPAILMLLSYSVYFFIFLFTSIAVSTFSSSSRRSLLLLFTFWITVCIVIPKLSVFVSERMYPTPSAYEFTEDIENETLQGSYEGVAHWQELNKKAENNLMAEYKVNSVDSLPVNVFGYALQMLEEEGHAAYERNYKRVDSLFVKQNSIHTYLSVLSPFTNMRFISMGIAGSDVGEYFHFIDFSERYRRNMMGILNEDIMEHQSHEHKSLDYKGGQDLWQKVPDYSYEPRTFATRFSGYVFNLLMLTIWLVISVAFVVFSIRRLKL